MTNDKLQTNWTTDLKAGDLNRVVAVLTTVRAGTSLMSSLLDNHPNVLTSPDCVVMGIYRFWDTHNHLDRKEIIDAFTNYYAVLFNPDAPCLCPSVGVGIGDYSNFNSMGPNRDQRLEVEPELFKSIFLKAVEDYEILDRKLFIQAFHLAYSESWGHRVTDPIISFPMHIAHPQVIEKFLEDFPEAFFLQMARNPVDGLASHMRMYAVQDALEPHSAVGAMAMARNLGSPVPSGNSSKWRAVKLEDLHSNPKGTLDRICDWLGLPWDDSLLQSTVNGLQWWNDKNTIQVSGINTAIISQSYIEYVPTLDRFILNILFAPKFTAWNYPVRILHRQILVRLMALPLLALPLKIERLSFTAQGSLSEKLRAYLKGRKFMLRAWLRTFNETHMDAKLV